MKFLQWNIWFQEDIRNILRTLREVDADIVCLQELTIGHPSFNVGIDTPKFIADGLGVNYIFKPAHDDPENTFGVGIFSRYPILQSSSVFIKQPKGTYDTHAHFSDQGRIYVECDIKIEERVLTVGSTHMSYTDAFVPSEAKNAEAENLVAILKKKEENYIFSGDLNALPDSYTIIEIEKYLEHKGPPYEEVTWTTKPFSYKGFSEDKLRHRLDYVFGTKDISTISARIISTPFSDHLPILVEF